MISYERAIIENLQGDTPRKKYEFLRGMQKLLQQVAYPVYGTEEANWTIQDVAYRAQMLVEQHEIYEDNSRHFPSSM